MSLAQMDVLVYAFGLYLDQLKTEKVTTFAHAGGFDVPLPRPFAYKLIYLYLRRWIQKLDYLVDECNWLYDSFLSHVLWMSLLAVGDLEDLETLDEYLDKRQTDPDGYFVQAMLNVAFDHYLFCLTTFDNDEELQEAIQRGSVDRIFGSIPVATVEVLEKMTHNERPKALAEFIEGQGINFVHLWEHIMRQAFLDEVSCIFADRDWEFKSAWNQEFDPEHCMQMGIDPSYFDNPDLNAVSEEEGEYYRDVSLKIITMYWEIRAKEYEQ